jgi:nucleotide-binding universal stress UspA family protein
VITAVVVAVWLICGCAVALVMVRRGHSPYLWLILVCFGPLAILFAIASRDDEAEFSPVVTGTGEAAPGRLHLLVGIDGTDISLAAAHRAVHLLNGAVGRATVAAVLDYEFSETHPRGDAEDEADGWLRRAADGIRDEIDLESGRVVLFGDPARELSRWAQDHGVNVIAVATRSHWTSRHLLAGSVTKGVVQAASCPVIVVPPNDPQSTAPAPSASEATT